MADECSLLAAHGLPVVVVQALDDLTLPPAARLMMWHLRLRLDFVVYREVKGASIAHEMRIKERTAHQSLTTVVGRGYLRVVPAAGRGFAYAFPWSRVRGGEREGRRAA